MQPRLLLCQTIARHKFRHAVEVRGLGHLGTPVSMYKTTKGRNHTGDIAETSELVPQQVS
jgi:hypothetical protein